jgi:hypothetical protein
LPSEVAIVVVSSTGSARGAPSRVRSTLHLKQDSVGVGRGQQDQEFVTGKTGREGTDALAARGQPMGDSREFSIADMMAPRRR